MSTEGLTINEIANHAGAMNEVDFKNRFGSNFLVRYVAIEPAKIAAGTMLEESKRLDPSCWQCYPLRRQKDSPYRFISIGRTKNNDVAVFDSSVSKFHAYLRELDGFQVCDGNSTNGTTVNGRQVPTREQGGALALLPGDVLQVGSIPLTFLELSDVLELKNRLQPIDGNGRDKFKFDEVNFKRRGLKEKSNLV